MGEVAEGLLVRVSVHYLSLWPSVEKGTSLRSERRLPYSQLKLEEKENLLLIQIWNMIINC